MKTIQKLSTITFSNTLLSDNLTTQQHFNVTNAHINSYVKNIYVDPTIINFHGYMVDLNKYIPQVTQTFDINISYICSEKEYTKWLNLFINGNKLGKALLNLYDQNSNTTHNFELYDTNITNINYYQMSYNKVITYIQLTTTSFAKIDNNQNNNNNKNNNF